MRAVLAITGVVCLLGGCASTPDVIYSYYPSRARTTVTVTQSVDCTADKSALVVLSTPTVNTVYSADYLNGPFSLHIKALDGAAADTDVEFTFYDDGRLKSVNAATTGEGETIIKSAVSLVTAVAALGGAAPPSAKGAPQVLPECSDVSNWGGGKPVTLSYGLILDPPTVSAIPVPFSVDASNATIYGKLQSKLPTLNVQVTAAAKVQSGARVASDSVNTASGVVPLTLQETRNVKLEVLQQGQAIFTGYLTIPLASTYQLPLPKAVFFGKESFALALSEAGAVTTIQYGKLSGSASPFNVGTAAANGLAPKSAADKAAEIQGQADLIAQQQRLIRCQAQPAQCQ
jgi:hypothetical protein